jgi:hypothetical protein
MQWVYLYTCKKKPKVSDTWGFYLAESEGFEPSVPCGTHTFQACSLSHSDNSPNSILSNFQLTRTFGRVISCDRLTTLQCLNSARRLQDTAFSINLYVLLSLFKGLIKPIKNVFRESCANFDNMNSFMKSV